MSDNAPTPTPKRWIWVGTFASIGLLAFGVVYSIFLHPHAAANRSVARFQSRGAKLSFDPPNESDWVQHLLVQLGNQDLAINVSHITISHGSKGLQDSDIPYCRAFPRLTGLELPEQKLTSECLRNIGGQGMKTLGLAGTQIGSGSKRESVPLRGVKELARFQELTTIDLSRTRVVDDDLIALSKLRKLTCVKLANTQVTSAGIAQLSNLNQLEYLNLSDTQINDDIAAHIVYLRSLEVLDLSGTRVTGKGLEKINLRHRLRLNLRNSSLNDEGLRSISLIPRLSGLNISNTHITRSGLEHLKTRWSLETLVMDGPSFSDDHLEVVATYPNLRWLSLFESHVTAAGIRMLEGHRNLDTLDLDPDLIQQIAVIASLHKMPKLQSVSVQAEPNHQVDEKAVQQQLGPSIRVHVYRIARTPK